jgi:hypothetical protein
METYNEDDLQWKMNFHGRGPQKLKIGVSQQPLVRSSPNLKLRLRVGCANPPLGLHLITASI